MEPDLTKTLPRVGLWEEGPRGLPPACYTSPEFYALEMERIFRRDWLCVGRADELSEPGDYLSLDLLGEPLVMVRDDAGLGGSVGRVARWFQKCCCLRATGVICCASPTVVPARAWGAAILLQNPIRERASWRT